MHHFHLLKTTKVAKETNDSVNIAFEIPPALKQEFSFKQGQYLNVRFLAGDEDTVIPPAVVEAAAKCVPGARFERVPKAGHSVYFERPDMFNELVEGFLGSR